MYVDTPVHILKMASASEVDVRTYDKESKKFVPTGGKEQLFEYIFTSVGEFPEKFVINSKKNFLLLEGKKVILGLTVKTGFGNKNQISLENIREADKAPK